MWVLEEQLCSLLLLSHLSRPLVYSLAATVSWAPSESLSQTAARRIQTAGPCRLTTPLTCRIIQRIKTEQGHPAWFTPLWAPTSLPWCLSCSSLNMPHLQARGFLHLFLLSGMLFSNSFIVYSLQLQRPLLIVPTPEPFLSNL